MLRWSYVGSGGPDDQVSVGCRGNSSSGIDDQVSALSHHGCVRTEHIFSQSIYRSQFVQKCH
jgi:hypothetical protein